MIQAKSAGFEAGNFAQILLNGSEVKLQKNEQNIERGLHIVVVDPSNGEVQFGKVFDTYKSSHELDSFISSPIDDGHIVVAACRDDCVTNLSSQAK